MAKTTMAAKRTSSLIRVENPNKKSGYKMVTVAFTINGKAAEMTITEQYKSSYTPNERGAKMIDWHFVTGDKMIDDTAKRFTDFSAFDIVDIEVDINDILFDAENFFEELKAKEKEEADLKQKKEREIFYDNCFLITVRIGCTKEEFVADSYRSMALVIDDLTLSDDKYGKAGWVVSNGRYGNDKIEERTRSNKTEKVVGIVVEALRVKKMREEEKAKEAAKKNDAKARLEAWLGEPVIQKDEKKGYYADAYRHKDYREAIYTHFVRASDPEGLRFTANKTYNSETKEYEETFTVSNIPSTFKAADKMKQLVAAIDKIAE